MYTTLKKDFQQLYVLCIYIFYKSSIYHHLFEYICINIVFLYVQRKTIFSNMLLRDTSDLCS